MSNKPKEIQDFMTAHGIGDKEVWQVHGKNWVVLHKALERVAARAGITFDRPAFLEQNSDAGVVAMVVFGALKDRQEWSIGEAHPRNNKNAYPYAMAEKRAKDRVILKLLNSEVGLYSEAEADEFTEPKRENPHVTRPDDVFEPAKPEDVIQAGPPPTKMLTVAEQKPIYAALQKEIHALGSVEAAMAWHKSPSVRARAGLLKEDFKEYLNRQYSEHKQALLVQEQGDEMRSRNPILMAG